MTDSAPYIGARIRLISKNDIRYEGTLHSIDSGRSTVILSEVRSFGSEGRKLDGQQIQPSNEIFDFIEFPSHDIKQLTVCQLPPSVPQQNPTPSGQQQGQPGPNPQGPFGGPMPGQFGMGMPYGPQGWNPYFNMYGPANPWSNQPQGFGMPNPLGGYPPLGMNPFQQGPGFGFPPGPMPGAPLNTPTPNANPAPTANATPVTPAAQPNTTPAANKPEPSAAKTETKSTATNATAANTSAVSDKKNAAPVTAAPAKNAAPSQPRPTQTATAPQSSNAKGQPTVQRPRNPWENKHHPTVVAPPSNAAGTQGPAQGQQGQTRERQQGQSRGQNGNYNQGRQQGGRGGHRGGRGGGGRQQYTVKAPTFTGDYDFEKSNEKFEHLLEELDIKDETTVSTPEPAYDKTRSFFDTISCEASEKKDDESLDRRAKNKLLQDQKRLDTETFGQMQVDQVYRDHMQQNQHYHRGHQGHRGHRGNYRGGQGGERQQRNYNQPQQRGYNSRGGRGGQSGQYKSKSGQNNTSGSNFKPVQPSNAAKQ
jgi:protein LSM14